jgi:hypothetical protein
MVHISDGFEVGEPRSSPKGGEHLIEWMIENSTKCNENIKPVGFTGEIYILKYLQ